MSSNLFIDSENTTQQFKNTLYPIFLKLHGKKVLVVGGGFIAWQKLIGLLDTDAKITVLAPLIRDEVKALKGTFPDIRPIEFIEKEYEFGDEKDYFIVIAATNIPELNNSIYNRCKDQGIIANSVDEPAHCDFYVPSIAKSGAIKVAISTNGFAPAISQKLRLFIEKVLDTHFAPLIKTIHEFRQKVRRKIPGERLFDRRAKLIRWFTDRAYRKIVGKDCSAKACFQGRKNDS